MSLYVCCCLLFVFAVFRCVVLSLCVCVLIVCFSCVCFVYGCFVLLFCFVVCEVVVVCVLCCCCVVKVCFLCFHCVYYFDLVWFGLVCRCIVVVFVCVVVGSCFSMQACGTMGRLIRQPCNDDVAASAVCWKRMSVCVCIWVPRNTHCNYYKCPSLSYDVLWVSCVCCAVCCVVCLLCCL